MGAAWKLRGYTVGELLGSGGSGDVWRATVAATGEAVALKRIPTPDPEQSRRAQREAALLSALDHPHLVRLHALVPTSDACVLVLDLADGGSLAGLLQARGRLCPGEVITALAPVAAALAYLHDAQVVHADVSPANVLFTPGGVALLADVGVARLTGDDAEISCTPAYVDPAVAAGSVPGPASDVFMLAATAVHALTGAPLWPGDAAAALALAACGRLDDVAERLAAAGVDPSMSAVLCRALSVDPHRRGTAADLALDLRHSGAPVAVELAAGRGRVVPASPRHAAPPPGSSPPGSLPPSSLPPGSGLPGSPSPGSPLRGAVPLDPLPVGPAVDPEAFGPEAADAAAAGSGPPVPGRPTFERPAWLGDAVSAAPPPTRLAGPRPRPLVPPPGKLRLRRGRPGRARIVTAAVVVAALAALVGAGLALWRSGLWSASNTHRAASIASGPAAADRGSARSAPHPVTTANASGTPYATSSVSPSATPSASPSGVATGEATRVHVQQVLERLDAERGAAFATRRPDLLTRVYVAGPLLRSDTALLDRLVPSGCGLRGVRTRYADLTATQQGARVIASLRAALAPSQLVCNGRLRARAPGTAPTPLHVELVETADGMRIAGQQVG